MGQIDTNFTNSTSISIPLQLVPSSTYQAKYFVVDTATIATESSTRIQEFIEESMWDNIFDTPHVKQGLRRLAAEALQEIMAGETEEGGFAVE